MIGAVSIWSARKCVTDAPPTLIDLSEVVDIPTIWADHDRLEQVFVNVFDNAVRHAVGVTTICVTSSLDDRAGTVTVRVSDDGCGIDDELRARVFLPRQRGFVDGSGAGLGLAIARGIVEAHGGAIVIEPTLRGTTVAVTIPLDRSEIDAPRDGFDTAMGDAIDVLRPRAAE